MTTGLLLAAGANINELNVVRKHLETLKGGGLARAAAPARVVALAISDVLGDPLDVIASGPCSGNTSSFADAWAVIERTRHRRRLPCAGRRASAARGCAGKSQRCHAPDDPIFARVHTSRDRQSAARRRSRGRCAPPNLAGSRKSADLTIEGEAREVAAQIVAQARTLVPGGRRCRIMGGETTVTVRGRRRSAGVIPNWRWRRRSSIAGRADIAVASVTTDGDDGPTGAAGAVAVGDTIARGPRSASMRLTFLARNDSATYFRAVGGLIVSGPTRTNVADLYFVLSE